MLIERSGTDYRLRLFNSDLVSGHRPFVDVRFKALAKHAAQITVAVIMTSREKMAHQEYSGCIKMMPIHLPKMKQFLWYLECPEKPLI